MNSMRMPLFYPEGEGAGGAIVEAMPEEQDQDRMAAAEALAAAAVSRYRDLVATGPGIVAELVRGSTIEEVDASAEAARQAYTNISRQIAQEYERVVPTGNPARSTVNAGAENLKPEAKIALGLRKL